MLFLPWAFREITQAELRLDLENEAFREKDGIAAFVRNSLEDSEAWHRIISDDPDEVMPPPKFKKELTKAEINTIKTWIEQGAEWEGHWAFIPVKKSDEPKTEMPNWVRNPIDSFVLKTLKEKDDETFPRGRPKNPHTQSIFRSYRTPTYT